MEFNGYILDFTLFIKGDFSIVSSFFLISFYESLVDKSSLFLSKVVGCLSILTDPRILILFLSNLSKGVSFLVSYSFY